MTGRPVELEWEADMVRHPYTLTEARNPETGKRYSIIRSASGILSVWLNDDTTNRDYLLADNVASIEAAKALVTERAQVETDKARLERAAPDMLEALRGVRELLWPAFNSSGQHEQEMATIDAAIAKAEGRA